MISDLFTFHRESHILNLFTCNFERNIITVVYEYAIMFACYIERNIFIRNLRSCTAIFIPDINNLTVLYKRCKSLTQTIYTFSRCKRKLCHHIWLILCCHIVRFREFCQRSSVILHIAKIAESDVCENFSICFICNLKVFQVHSYCHSSGFHHSFIFCNLNLCFLRILIQLISWLTFYITFIMITSYAYNIFTCRSKFCSDSSYIQSTASVCDLAEWRNNSHSSRNCLRCKSLHRIGCVCAFIFLPVTFCELHS